MIKDYFKSRAVGFYLTVGAALLMLIAVIAYPPSFIHTSYDFKVELFMILGLGLALVLIIGGIFIKGLDNWAPAALGAGGFLALLYYALSSVDIVVKVVGGYETEQLPVMFYFMLVMLVLILVICSVTIFLRQTKVQMQA